MRLDDRAADRKSQPHTKRFRRDERLEDPVGEPVGYAGPGIGHRNLDSATALAASLNDDRSSIGIGGLNRIDGVLQEVEHHLLNLNMVSQIRNSILTSC